MSDNNESKKLRELLLDAMGGDNAHLDFSSAVEDFPAELQSAKPAGAPHTAWQLLEHMRIAQWDILEFSRDPKHKSPRWPEGYWPETDAPPDSEAWNKSIQAFQEDASQFAKLVQDTDRDLFKPLKRGEPQTLLREALLVANHNSYHLGQLMYLKKTLMPD